MKTAEGITVITNGQLIDSTGSLPVPDPALLVKCARVLRLLDRTHYERDRAEQEG
jgi:hypothetical protein